MQANQSKILPILGSDQSLFPKTGFLERLVNVRCNANDSWSNDVGWEPLLNTMSGTTYAEPTGTTAALFSPVRFLRYWQAADGVAYYLYERNGSLIYDWGTLGSATSRTVVLKTDRTLPKTDDPGTQLIDCKGFALLINGQNEPVKFWGRERIEQFSWSTRPGIPTPFAPQPEAIEPAPTAVSIEPLKATIKFSSKGDLGLGDSANGSTNTYGYRVAFLSNTGSLGPLSEMAVVNWIIDGTSQEGRYGVVLASIPVGPQGTVGRVIYRTKNMKDGLSPGLAAVYETGRIMENVTTTWIDISPDSRLNATPQDLFASSPISHLYKYGAMFDNRVWLAYDNKIIYSESNLYEQFPEFNYLETGNGSPITGLVPYYNGLVVFREAAIDIVSRGQAGYTISVLDGSVGTTATNTITNVPGLGICFLAPDGVRALSGGLDGGSVVRNNDIGKPLTEEWERLSRGSMAKACASLSLRDNEWWVHYPADGSFENTRGAVLHLTTGGWSLRNNEEGTQGTLRFSAMTTDKSGYTIMGTVPTKVGSVSTWKSWPGIGLQVWSHAPYASRKLTYVSTGGGNYNWSVADESKLVATLASPYMDFGSLDIQKNVVHVILEGLTQGNSLIPLVWTDGESYKTVSAKALPALASAHYNTSNAQNMYGPLTGNDKPVAVFGSGIWEESRRYLSRFDIGATATSSFSWRITTSNPFSFYAGAVAYMLPGTRTVYHYG